MIERKLKFQIVDKFERFIEKHFNFFNKKTIGTIIRSFHIVLPFNIIVLFLFGPKNINIFNLIFLFSALFFFYLFKGCFLTIIETRFCGDEFTFIDPFIEFHNLKLNNKNRYKISIYVALLYVLIMIFIFLLRFYIYPIFIKE